jgi:hypothetical protein
VAKIVRVTGLDDVLKKLDVEYLTEPIRRRVFREAAEEGRDYLSDLVPKLTGASARTEQLQIRDQGYSIEDAGARLSVTADPLRYLEFGTKAGAAKSIVRRGGRSLVRTSGGTQRIKKRRFMAKTIGRTRSEMRKRLEAAASEIEKQWSK